MAATAMQPEAVRRLAVDALEGVKAENLVVLDVRGRTAITDFMIFASGTSQRHVQSLAQGVIDAAAEHGLKPLGVEGKTGAEWVLVDLGDAVVHVMRPEIRDFYRLENIWGVDDEESAADDYGRSV